jgi:D-arabinose 1-dehydrogenase-like Zn-dependent alcohol dehydrogenase
MQVVRIHAQGGPEVMQVEDLPTPEPGPGQVRIRVAAAGVNFIDIYHRNGQYKVPLPFVLGREGAGTVEALGPGVTELSEGQPVAWAGVAGSYATHVLATPAEVVPVPLGFDLREAAAAMHQGMTAHYLTNSTFPLAAGQTCLIHAAAGGVGQLFCQMAKMRRVTIIGTVSTDEKARLARDAGADEIILYRALQGRLTLGADNPGVESEPVHTAHVARVLDLHTAVDDHVQAAVRGGTRALRTDHAELQPQRTGADPHGLFGNRRHCRRGAEDVDHVHMEGNVAQAGVRLLAKYLALVRVDRHHGIAVAPEVKTNKIARPQRVRR